MNSDSAECTQHTQRREPLQVSVRFADPQIKTIDTNYADEEANTLWYSNRDLNQIDRKNRYDIRALKKAKGDVGVLERGEEYCIRGLEHKLSIRAQIERQSNTVSVIQSVLNEQKRQRELGVIDPNRIESQSRRASYKAGEIALERAKIDELEILCRASAGGTSNNKLLRDNHSHSISLASEVVSSTLAMSSAHSSSCHQHTPSEALQLTELCLTEVLLLRSL